ncbi:MAG: response regulator transcription factor [Microbacterium arborescens]
MGRTAVVVEDQADIRSLLTAILESSGFEVHGAENGLDAVETIRSVAPDVTTLDVNIPGIDGFEVARRVREFSDTYIIFISAFVEPGDAERGRAAGGDEYLGKPFRPRDLKARLAAIPSRRRRETSPLDEANGASGGDGDETTVRYADIEITGAQARVAGTPLLLDLVGNAVLRRLVDAGGRPRSKEELALGLRARTRADPADADEIRAVEKTVESLRQALSEAGAHVRVESDLGVGYRLVAS